MNPINSALWFIEAHLVDDLSLESIATQVDVSPYYLTRAFGSLFGLSMTHQQLPELDPPRFHEGKALLIAGIGARYQCENKAGIPAQWQRFLPHFGHSSGQVSNVAYGVVYNSDDEGNIDYLCGAEVRDFTHTPAEFTTLRVPPQRYVVFRHRDHISTISGTFAAIWTRWLPASGHQVVDAPLLEVYGPEFDGLTGNGGLEVWIPIKS